MICHGLFQSKVVKRISCSIISKEHQCRCEEATKRSVEA